MSESLRSADPSPEEVTRFGRDAQTTATELGPLANLVGTWFGQGWSVGAVPEVTAEHTDGVRSIIFPVVEMLTFEPLGAPVPNRAAFPPPPPEVSGDLFVFGLMYETRISNAETHVPVHLENGMWLNLGSEQEMPIVRQAAIPHGDALQAPGRSTTIQGKPDIPTHNARPTGQPPDAPFGYIEPWTLKNTSCFAPPDGFLPEDPTGALQAAIKDQTILETTVLEVSTENGGGIFNVPFVAANANTPRFQCTYWIETVEDPDTKDQYMQLQYWQQTDMFFFPNSQDPAQLINWPHVQVNTLVKQ